MSEQREAQPAPAPAAPEPAAPLALELIGRVEVILALSRTCGNWAVGRALRRGSLPRPLAALLAGGSGAAPPAPPQDGDAPPPVLPPRRRRRRPPRLAGRVRDLGQRTSDAGAAAHLRRARDSRAGPVRPAPPAPAAQEAIRGHRYRRD